MKNQWVDKIMDHRVAIRQRSKTTIHMSFFDAVFAKIMTCDLIKNKLFSIKMKRESFTTNWSDFDNSKVEHDEIKNSNTDKF